MNNKTILIVEDEVMLVESLKLRLQRDGYSVFTAREGKSGLEIALHEKPDLILLDLIMPIMDGLSMLEELRKDPWGKTAKIVMLTNLQDEAKTKRARLLDIKDTDYILKADSDLNNISRIVAKKLA